jgi:hypothetical protein
MGSKVLLQDNGALAAFRLLVEALEAGICSPAEFDGFLNDDPVFWRINVEGVPTLSTGELIATVEPTERLKALVAAMAARNEKTEAVSGGRVFNINREHGRAS